MSQLNYQAPRKNSHVEFVIPNKNAVEPILTRLYSIGCHWSLPGKNNEMIHYLKSTCHTSYVHLGIHESSTRLTHGRFRGRNVAVDEILSPHFKEYINESR